METTLTRDQLPQEPQGYCYHTGRAESGGPERLITNYDPTSLNNLTKFEEGRFRTVADIRTFLIDTLKRKGELPKDPILTAIAENKCHVLPHTFSGLHGTQDAIREIEQIQDPDISVIASINYGHPADPRAIIEAIRSKRMEDVMRTLHHTPLRIVQGFRNNLLIADGNGGASVPVVDFRKPRTHTKREEGPLKSF